MRDSNLHGKEDRIGSTATRMAVELRSRSIRMTFRPRFCVKSPAISDCPSISCLGGYLATNVQPETVTGNTDWKHMAKNIGRGGELFKQLFDPEHLIQSARAAGSVPNIEVRRIVSVALSQK